MNRLHIINILILFLALGNSVWAQKVDALTQMPQAQQTPNQQTAPNTPNKPIAPSKPVSPASPNLSSPSAQQQQQSQKTISPSQQYLREMTTVPYKVSHKIKRLRHKATRKGVHALKKNNFSEAVTDFRMALKADSSFAKAQYNAAIAHASLQQNDSALAYYHQVCENNSATSLQRANAHYNAGNIHLRKALSARDTGGYDGQSLHAAISEYKASLRLDPTNTDTQHNLSLARQLLRPESQDGNGGGQNQQQQNNQDQNQQQNKDQQNKQDQQQNNQNQQQQDQQNQQDQQQQNQQKKQDNKQQEQRRREAEQMLNAMKNNEQQTMKAVRMKEAEKEQRHGRPTKIEKDW